MVSRQTVCRAPTEVESLFCYERFVPLLGWRASNLLSAEDPAGAQGGGGGGAAGGGGLALSNGLVGNLGLALSWGARTLGAADFPAHGSIDGQPLPRHGDHVAWREKLREYRSADGARDCFSWLSDTWLPYVYTTADQEDEGEIAGQMPGGGSDGPGGGAGGIGLTDEAGWQYAFHFGTISTQPVWSAASDGCFVRRRQLCRKSTSNLLLLVTSARQR